jgi:SAM-dependent methyltransferase
MMSDSQDHGNGIDRSAEHWLEAYRSGAYLEKWHYDHPSPELVSLVSCGLIKPGARVLEVGCGAGTDSIYLAAAGVSVTGWDISQTAIDLARSAARSAGVRVTFQRVDIFSPMVPRTNVDAVIDRGCLHNIPLEQWPEFARRVHRFLHKGSGLYFVRGSREPSVGQQIFTPLTPANVTLGFSVRFSWTRIEPFMLLANKGLIPAAMVLMRAKSKVG